MFGNECMLSKTVQLPQSKGKEKSDFPLLRTECWEAMRHEIARCISEVASLVQLVLFEASHVASVSLNDIFIHSTGQARNLEVILDFSFFSLNFMTCIHCQVPLILPLCLSSVPIPSYLLLHHNPGLCYH